MFEMLKCKSGAAVSINQLLFNGHGSSSFWSLLISNLGTGLGRDYGFQPPRETSSKADRCPMRAPSHNLFNKHSVRIILESTTCLEDVQTMDFFSTIGNNYAL